MTSEDRRETILKHVARYRLTFRPVLERLFFQGKTCDNVVTPMVNERLLVSCRELDAGRSSLPGGYAYYQIGPEGRKRPYVSSYDAKPIPSAAFEKCVALLWLCFFGPEPASLLDKTHMAQLFEESPEGPFCLEIALPRRLLRPIVVTPGSKDSYFVRRVEQDLDAAERHQKLRYWVELRYLQYFLLVPNVDRGKQLRNKLKQHLSRVDIQYFVVPTVETLHKALAGVSKT